MDSRIDQSDGYENRDILIKGVIEILSSIIELGGLKCSEDKVGNSTALIANEPL